MDSLRDKVHATVDQDANVINIVATDDTARGAAAIANAVAATFLTRQRRAERQQLARRPRGAEESSWPTSRRR